MVSGRLAFIIMMLATTSSTVVSALTMTVGFDQTAMPLSIPDGAALDNAGWRVAAENDWVVVSSYRDDDRGTNSGSLLVYRVTSEGPVYHSKLTGVARAFDRLGSSLDMEADLIAAGSPEHDTAGRDAGSVTVFRLEDDSWIREATLFPGVPDLFATFGTSVSLSGSTMIVGSPGQGAGKGAAYVFERNQSSRRWGLKQRIDPPISESLAFGSTVSVDGNIAVVGSSANDIIFVYEKIGDVWTLSASFEYPGPTRDFSNFGTWVDVNGPWVMTGAHGEASAGDFSGAVYIYKKNVTAEWGLHQRLEASDARPFGRFGTSVRSRNEIMVIGSDGADGPVSATGAVYLFQLEENQWVERSRVVPSVGTRGDQFGSSVAISNNDYVVVGAPESDESGEASGAAYYFQHSLSISTAVDEPEVPKPEYGCNISVYPNPSSGLTFLRLPSDHPGRIPVTISDVLGRVVYDTVVDDSGGKCMDIRLELNDLSPGIYIARTGRFDSKIFSIINER